MPKDTSTFTVFPRRRFLLRVSFEGDPEQPFDITLPLTASPSLLASAQDSDSSTITGYASPPPAGLTLSASTQVSESQPTTAISHEVPPSASALKSNPKAREAAYNLATTSLTQDTRSSGSQTVNSSISQGRSGTLDLDQADASQKEPQCPFKAVALGNFNGKDKKFRYYLVRSDHALDKPPNHPSTLRLHPDTLFIQHKPELSENRSWRWELNKGGPGRWVDLQEGDKHDFEHGTYYYIIRNMANTVTPAWITWSTFRKRKGRDTTTSAKFSDKDS